MLNLLMVVAGALLLAYCSQHRIGILPVSRTFCLDLAYVITIVLLVCYCGLRTNYNDTLTYINGFQNAQDPLEYLSGSPSLMDSPLFFLLQSVFRHYISDNVHLFFMVTAAFTIMSFVWFIKKYAEDFVFSMFLFLTLLYLFPFAAVKQSLAMAVLAIAMDRLLDGRYPAFFCLVFLAMLFHGYAAIFAVLPVFVTKPWSAPAYAAVLAAAAVIAAFEPSVTLFVQYAQGLGLNISAEELFSQQGMNLFRVAVFGVPPIISFVFQRVLLPSADRRMALMVNMSIISFLLACMGAVHAANMFGRSAMYFMFGTILALPWMIQTVFEPKSARLVKHLAVVCYAAFFLYDIRSFAAEYRGITLIQFLERLFA